MTRNNFHYCLKAESFKYYPSSCPGPVVWILGSSLKMKRLNLTNSGACPPRLSADLTRRSHQAPRPHTRSFLSPRKLLNLSPLLLRSLAKPQHKQRRPYQAPAANTSAEQRIYLNLPLALEAPRGPRRGASPTCLRIHSHLRIKFLTLMLLVMLGPAPGLNPGIREY